MLQMDKCLERLEEIETEIVPVATYGVLKGLLLQLSDCCDLDGGGCEGFCLIRRIQILRPCIRPALIKTCRLRRGENGSILRQFDKPVTQPAKRETNARLQ